MKKFRCHFEVRGHTFRDVLAIDASDAQAQVEGDSLEMFDLEIAQLESICVDDVEEMKSIISKKKKKKRK